jgi:hypothetical protein
MLYALVITILLGGPSPPAKHKKPVMNYHTVTFTIPYPSLFTCQEGQRVAVERKQEGGIIGARQWLPQRLAPIAAETSCVAQPTLGL